MFYLFAIINKTHGNKLKGGSPKENNKRIIKFKKSKGGFQNSIIKFKKSKGGFQREPWVPKGTMGSL